MSVNTETAILSRLIKPERNDLAEEVARYLLRIDFNPKDLARMNELAALANAGTVNDDQRQELENFNHVGHLLALLHSKARRSLSKSSAA
jgi:hypothetical protein